MLKRIQEPEAWEPQINQAAFEALDMAIKALEKEPRKGHWIDYSDEGFVECSECGSATNCDGNIADLHFCFSCGAKMIEPQESEE